MIHKTKGKIYPFDSEYIDEVYKRLKEGGILWLIERTDTNEFLVEELVNVASGCFSSRSEKRDVWISPVPTYREILLTYITGHYYLTKEDAENGIKHGFREGGCSYCGHGSKKIPIIITEHEFVN